MPDITQIGVVVPAKSEQQHLAACLEALTGAARHSPVPVMIVVVLDNCTDDSAAVAATAATQPSPAVTVTTLTIDADSVGAARSAGMAHILAHHSRSTTWLATTDADSRVPPGWFSTQLGHARRGAELVVGTVYVDDWTGRSDAVRDRAIREYAQPARWAGRPDDSGTEPRRHGHIHGANLSFAAEAYRAVGGFAQVTHDEDVSLVAALLAADAHAVWDGDLVVTTSARRHARAPHGFAAYLTDLDRHHAWQVDPREPAPRLLRPALRPLR